MGVAANIVSAVLKAVVGDKFGSGLVKEITDISIDGISEKSINKIADFINGEKSKIELILSKEDMKSFGIAEDTIDYVVVEIKELLSKIDVTDDMLRHCRYDSKKLSEFLWNEYKECKNDYIECESEIKRCLFVLAEALIELVRESESFERDVVIHISNSVNDVNAKLQNISEQIQKMNMQDNKIKSTTDDEKKFKNNKKEDYIANWNNRLFLHIDDENPITLKDAFIMPDYEIYKSIGRIGYSDNDTLDQIIEKFVNYEKTSTMLIAGVPGIGKSTITSWIANKYKDNERIIVLRFRDWKKVILETKLLEAICKKLDCEEEDLESKVLVLDGFDEMKALNIRNRLLNEFVSDIKDFENFKCIITSRLGYIDSSQFHNVLILNKFDIKRVEDFVKIITGDILKKRERIESNLEVLGIPVILYMAVMSNIDISENPTKPELYNRIFAEKGGIFDRFSFDGLGYDKGVQVLRNGENIKSYLSFLQKVAFLMFEKNGLSLKMDDCNVPELEFQGNKVSVLEFPIKHLFENAEFNVEFIHKSIYEYFVSEYIFTVMEKGINTSKEKIAEVLGKLLKIKRLPSEVLEFLKFRINSKLKDKFDLVKETFEIMLQNGLTYSTKKIYKNTIDCEVMIFANMLDIVHLWEGKKLKFNSMFCHYLHYNYNVLCLNLSRIDLRGVNLKGIDLEHADLKEANLKGAKLERANLIQADLRKADLKGIDLRSTNLRQANIEGAFLKRGYLKGANLEGASMIGANLVGVDLTYANLKKVIFDEKQVEYLKQKYSLIGTRVYIEETKNVMTYEAFCKRKR